MRLGGDGLEVAQHREEELDRRVDERARAAHHLRLPVGREVAGDAVSEAGRVGAPFVGSVELDAATKEILLRGPLVEGSCYLGGEPRAAGAAYPNRAEPISAKIE